MVRYMADSTQSGQIPDAIPVPGGGVEPISLRCGYLGGSYQASSHTGRVDVNIDVDGTHPNADVLDIETGDATPDTAPVWVKAHNSANTGFPAVLYCNRSTIHAVANYCQAAGLVVGKDFYWWIATLDGTQTVPDMTGVVAVQVWGANYFPGHNIDLSIVYNDTFKNTGGFLSMLSDAEQADLYNKVTQIYEGLYHGGASTPNGEPLSNVIGEIRANQDKPLTVTRNN